MLCLNRLQFRFCFSDAFRKYILVILLLHAAFERKEFHFSARSIFFFFYLHIKDNPRSYLFFLLFLHYLLSFVLLFLFIPHLNSHFDFRPHSTPLPYNLPFFASSSPFSSLSIFLFSFFHHTVHTFIRTFSGLNSLKTKTERITFSKIEFVFVSCKNRDLFPGLDL